MKNNENNYFWKSQHKIYLKKVNFKRFLLADVLKVLFEKVQNKFGTHFFISWTLKSRIFQLHELLKCHHDFSGDILDDGIILNDKKVSNDKDVLSGGEISGGKVMLRGGELLIGGVILGGVDLLGSGDIFDGWEVLDGGVVLGGGIDFDDVVILGFFLFESLWSIPLLKGQQMKKFLFTFI